MTHILQFKSPLLTLSETEHVAALLKELDWDDARAGLVKAKTIEYIQTIRNKPAGFSDIETFLQNYPLSSIEGRALMTLAEALLRIPDTETADALIAEKLAVSNWDKIGGTGLFANASSFGLGLAKSMLGGFLSGISKPVIRKATFETVRRLGAQFVVGENIGAALKIAAKHSMPHSRPHSRMSFDMLGEGARTTEDAERYFKTYKDAVNTIGDTNNPKLSLMQKNGMSVKLSALHPRYSWAQADTCVPEMTEKLLELCKIAAEKDLTLTVDAEESERLEMHLDIVTRVALSSELKGWDGFGLAVQAYDRRALDVIDYICHLSTTSGQRLQVRLVKGAYWDGEIKRAQTAGWNQYPVFTRKLNTDLSYLACTQKMLAARHLITPLFATHNAATAAAILELAGADKSGFEVQQLYGMGSHLGDILRTTENITVAQYAPVGSYEDLLPYLVRRMLENGANTSFVSQIRDASIPLENLARDVVSAVIALNDKPFPLSLPENLYGSDRLNSKGYDLSKEVERERFFSKVKDVSQISGISDKSSGDIDRIFQSAKIAFENWNQTPAISRAIILRKSADLMENNTGALIKLLQTEGKKTVFDAIAEIREAVDFCRYYAAQGEKDFCPEGIVLKGPTGERNTLNLSGRGIFIALSPWNFPLAIFIGQVAAALMAGNTVIAKPAEQTPKIANFAVLLLHQAGVPKDVLQLLQGDGKIGSQLVAHKDVAGVVFTGSSEVARLINRSLSAKEHAIVPLIAETGGQNAMIVDSTALPEQVLDDVLLSAFGSAGQRCSALRVLYLQNDIADRIIHLLKGALPLLKIGQAEDVRTDVPPVIDADALKMLQTHVLYLNSFATFVTAAKIPNDLSNDTYFAPCIYEIDSLDRLKGEVFGPILHIIRYKAENLEKIIAEINATGYGLTFGFHSRLTSRHELVAKSIRAGNIYLNRNMIGAVVGVQPFGGQGLSGTGPKAGGPYYLHRFATEITITDNIMATGGNIDLLSSLEE